MQTVDGTIAVVEGAPTADERAADAGADGQGPLAIPPLSIGAFMVTKEALVGALRPYVPHLTDVEAIPGDRYLLYVGADHPDDAEAR